MVSGTFFLRGTWSSGIISMAYAISLLTFALMRLQLPLQPSLRDPAHVEFPRHGGLGLQRGESRLYLLHGHLKFDCDI